MRYLGEDEVNQMMGFGYLGEVRTGPDGNLYQWVETVDGLGNPIGFWKALRRLAKRVRPFLRRALPIAQRFAPSIPGVGPAAAAALTAATPILRQAGVSGHNGLGALYQAPDGTLFQVQGLAQDEELRGLAQDEEIRGIGEDELTQVMGIGYLGEVRTGPDGNLYQWVETVDGLGNPIGFWKALRRLAKRVRPFLRRALPFVQKVASYIPIPQAQAVAAGLKVATPLLQRAGVSGHNGLGALYQAPDGTLYQVQGLAEDGELQGLAEDEELSGFSEDDELRGLAEDEELSGIAEDEGLTGFSEDEEIQRVGEEEELRGLSEDEELQGLDQGYVREGTSGLDAYIPEQQPTTRWFVSPNQPPEMWKPLW